MPDLIIELYRRQYRLCLFDILDSELPTASDTEKNQFLSSWLYSNQDSFRDPVFPSMIPRGPRVLKRLMTMCRRMARDLSDATHGYVYEVEKSTYGPNVKIEVVAYSETERPFIHRVDLNYSVYKRLKEKLRRMDPDMDSDDVMEMIMVCQIRYLTVRDITPEPPRPVLDVYERRLGMNGRLFSDPSRTDQAHCGFYPDVDSEFGTLSSPWDLREHLEESEDDHVTVEVCLPRAYKVGSEAISFIRDWLLTSPEVPLTFIVTVDCKLPDLINDLLKVESVEHLVRVERSEDDVVDVFVIQNDLGRGKYTIDSELVSEIEREYREGARTGPV